MFPHEFFDPEVCKRYEFILKTLPTPYKTIRDYCNAGIQEFSLPSVTMDTVEQDALHNPNIPWKGKGNMEYKIDKTFKLTMKNYEGYVNYWIFFELLQKFYEYTNRLQFLPDLYLTFTDNRGYEMFTWKFARILYTGISELSLSFTTNVPEMNNFNIDFRYTTFELLRRFQ